MIHRVYKHHCRYQHNVEDNPELIDKACLTPHKHGFYPNNPCAIEFILATEKWIDFKTIKQVAIDTLKIIAESDDVRTDGSLADEQFGPLPFYDFGTKDTETLIEELYRTFMKKLPLKYKPAMLQIWMDETNKYSVWYDGGSLKLISDSGYQFPGTAFINQP